MLGKHHDYNNNNNFSDMKMYRVMTVAAAAFGLASCGTTDTEVPTICDADNLTGLPSVMLDEIEVDAGTGVVVNDAFCDDTDLGEIRWDLHSAEGHEHEEGEEEGFVLNSGTDWAVLETRAVSGTKAEAPDVITLLHVENDHIPEFSLQTVDGVDPASWEGEPMWAPGAQVAVQGTVGDSDGISEAEVLLIRGSDETVVWSKSLVATGDTLLAFSVQVAVPADAEVGEYHFEMEATDGTGVEMHTGFHVEVE